MAAQVSIPAFMQLPSTAGYFEVQLVRGARLTVESERAPRVDYLVQWKVSEGDCNISSAYFHLYLILALPYLLSHCPP